MPLALLPHLVHSITVITCINGYATSIVLNVSLCVVFVIEEGFSPEHTCPNSLFGK